MSEFFNALKQDTNYTYTENGGITHKSTMSKVLDMFAMGGSMRNRTNDDIITMFKGAYEEDTTLALKCLFYLRDCRSGAGERRFFRVCLNWLANEHPREVKHLIPYVSTYGRYDDLYVLVATPCQSEMFQYLKTVVDNNEDYLVFKWLKSENCSSKESKNLAAKTREAFGMSARDYRKMLSEGRKNCHLVETLMSQNEWDKIAFDKLPSRAGLLYKNAFMRREETRYRYADFMSNKMSKVNASVLTPVDIAHQIFNARAISPVERAAWQKYWDALPDYYDGHEEPGIAVVDTSGSMFGKPLEAAVSMGAYIAERGYGPFHNHFITFSDAPSLIEFKGADIYDKFTNARRADWGGSTNIETVFNLLLKTGIKHHISPDKMPQTIYIFSDMEFNRCINYQGRDPYSYSYHTTEDEIDTVIEAQAKKWQQYGYFIPRIIFWNLDARQDNIPAIGPGFSYVSGFSMNMIECILSGRDGYDLMLAKLNSDRYKNIVSIF